MTEALLAGILFSIFGLMFMIRSLDETIREIWNKYVDYINSSKR